MIEKQTQAEDVTFADVFGLKEEIDEVRTIFTILSDAEKYTELGAILPKGVILSGEPGTGKTLLARILSKEFALPFHTIIANEFKDKDTSAQSNCLVKMFEKASQKTPSVVFIDELDSFLGCNRPYDCNTVLVNQLLSLMDGFYQNNQVFVLAATNRIKFIPPSLLRPGRFDKTIKLDLPDADVRFDVLRNLTKNIAHDSALSLEKVANLITGKTIAEIKQITSDAIINVVKTDQKQLTLDDFITAIDRQNLGIMKKEDNRKEETRIRTAIHEAGHALMQYALMDGENFNKVSITKTSDSHGHMSYGKFERGELLNEEELKTMIAILLAGPVSEKIMCGSLSMGIESDIERATNIATHMVKQTGMSDLGLRYFGKEKLFSEPISEHYNNLIDETISGMIQDIALSCSETIKANATTLEAIVQALLEKNLLLKPEVDSIIKAYPLIKNTT